MEYAEDDEPDQTTEESKLEAHANIPNIPIPRGSDGNVRTIFADALKPYSILS